MGWMKELTEENLEPVHKSLGFLDGMLKDHDYAAGNCLTIADLSLVATVSSFDVSLSQYHSKPLSDVYVRTSRFHVFIGGRQRYSRQVPEREGLVSAVPE